MSRLLDFGHTIEELNYARMQRILGANHEKTILLDQLLQHLGAVS